MVVAQEAEDVQHQRPGLVAALAGALADGGQQGGQGRVGLADLALREGRPAEAIELLRPVETDPEVAVLLASARLAAEAADPTSRFATAAAQASDGQADPALATLLDAVREGPGETRDKARGLMLDVFRLLGDDHPLTSRYRRDLTRALF